MLGKTSWKNEKEVRQGIAAKPSFQHQLPLPEVQRLSTRSIQGVELFTVIKNSPSNL